MKTQFTPGPWHVNSPYIEDQHGTIAKVMRPEDNAALIAAAPDLFEALEEVIRISDRKHAAWDKAKAALAKAKGE